MTQTLTVCRHGGEWAVRDATGEHYGHSPIIDEAVEAAHRLARRNGSAVVLSAEAAASVLTSSIALDHASGGRENRAGDSQPA